MLSSLSLPSIRKEQRMKQLFQNNPVYRHAYKHGALLAVFIGLFILSACGGGGGAAVVLVDSDVNCETTPFAEGCETSETAKVARTTIVDDCREALKNDGTCADSAPPAAVTCLTDPFSEECAAEAVTANPFEGTDFTLNEERATRRTECRGTLEDSSCRNAIASYCGAVESPSLSTLFDALCLGTAYAPARQAECRNNIANEACTATITNFCGAVGAANTGALFDDLCAGTDYTPERQTECRNNGLAEDGAANGKCATIKTTFCDGDDVGDNPHAAVCGDNLTNQQRFCRLDNNAGVPNCLLTIATVCHVETGNPFDVFCSGNNDDRKTRADACLAQTKTGNDCTTVATCNTAPFGEGCDATIYATALEAFCTKGDNIFDGQCINGTHGEVTAARVSACSGAIAALPNDDASLCNKADLSGAICGDGDSVVGSNSFADICKNETGNINYGTRKIAQEAFCRIGDIGRPECEDTVTDFCGAVGSANTGTLFNDLCAGAAYIPERRTECRRDINNGLCGDTITDFCGEVGAATVGNLFNDLCLGAGYMAERLTACKGDITALPSGDASLCNKANLSGAICGTGGVGGTIGSDPFADICSDDTATAVIDTFDKDMEQQEFCGATRKSGDGMVDCAGIYTGLCTGADLFDDDAGAGNFDCSQDGAFDDARLNFCKIDANSFNANCNEDDYNGTDAARTRLAETCRGDPTDTGCTTFVNGVDGVTVADCTNHLTEGDPGDPYQTGCGDKVFNDQKTARVVTCGEGANASIDALCGNAIATDACIRDPYGNDNEGAACVASDYTTARMERDTYCRNNAPANAPLCSTEIKDMICGDTLTHNPFASLCGNDGNNGDHRIAFCALTQSGDTNSNNDCSNDMVSLCTRNPFGTDLGISGNIDCTSGGDYVIARQNFCATGMENGNDCDTGEIAPAVCGTDTDANYNPFATFCLESANDGKSLGMRF